MPQLSVATAPPGVYEAQPLPAHSSVTGGGHAIAGSSQSLIVTSASHVAVSVPSLTASVTGVVPTGYGGGGACVTVSGSPSGSDDPTSIVATPLHCPGVLHASASPHSATGGWFSGAHRWITSVSSASSSPSSMITRPMPCALTVPCTTDSCGGFGPVLTYSLIVVRNAPPASYAVTVRMSPSC